MSVIPANTGFANPINPASFAAAPSQLPELHRLADVRRQHGVSVRSLARRLRMSEADVQRQERARDLPLSVLYKWQVALDVPITELLAEPDTGLSPNINCRAALLKIMKTVRLIEQSVRGERLGFLVQRLLNQLIELMPELNSVAAWPAVGSRRTGTEISPIEERAVTQGSFDSAWVNGERG